MKEHGYKAPFVRKVAFYSQKVLPLVFDNSLSYLESLAHFCHKLNELINALNNQTLQIIEFEKELALTLDLFEKEIRERQDAFEQEMQEAFAAFKAEILAEWDAVKAEWAEMKTDWTEFQTEIRQIQADFEAQITAQQNAFEAAQTQRQQAFETAETAARTAFETAQTQRQQNFESSETAAREAFQQGMTQGFNAFTTSITNQQNGFETSITQRATAFEAHIEDEISGLELGDPNAESAPIPSAMSFGSAGDPERISISGAAAYINNGLGDNDFIRVYRNANFTEQDYIFVKRLHFADLALDSDITDVSGDSARLVIVFENPAIMAFFTARPGDFSLTAERTTTTTSGLVTAHSAPIIPLNPAVGDTLPLEVMQGLSQIGYMSSSSGSGLVNFSGNFDSGAPGKFLVLILTNVKKNFQFRISSGSAAVEIPIRPGYFYDANNSSFLRDPKVTELDSKYTSAYIYQTAGGTSTKTITLEPSAAYVVFLTFGSWCNVYFLNSTTTRAYIKTVVDQMNADITATYTDLSVTFTSTAGNAFTLFAKRIST